MRAGASTRRMGHGGGAALVCAGLVPFLCACSSITVQGAKPLRVQQIGTLRLAPVEGETASVVMSQGLGLIPGRGGVTLGYSRETTISFSDARDCRVVILADRSTNLAALREILGDINQAGGKTCAFTKDGKPVAP